MQQNKTHKRLRIQMTDGDEPNSLGLLIGKMAERNAQHICTSILKTVGCNRSMSSNPNASAIFVPTKP